MMKHFLVLTTKRFRAFFLMISFLAIGLILFPGVSHSATEEAVTEAEVKELWKQVKWNPDREKSWIEFEKYIPNGPSHEKYPWLPAEKYPFTLPHTGREIRHLNWDAKFFGNYDYQGYSVRVNKRGHMIQRLCMASNEVRTSYEDIIYPDKGLARGEWYYRIFQIYETPPELRAQGFLVKLYKENPEYVKHPDYWMYLPGMKRIRRMGSGDKEDDCSGADISWDDLFMRMPWEEYHRLIGTDCLFKGENITAFNYGLPKLWSVAPAVTPPYKKIGDKKLEDDYYIECYVVESFPQNPKYYLSRRICWYEKETKTVLREEQYDRAGRLFRIFDYIYPCKLPEGIISLKDDRFRIEGGFYRAHNGFTIQLDHRTDATKLLFSEFYWGKTYDSSRFNPQQLTKEVFWLPKSSAKPYKSFKNIPPMVPLFLDKFPNYRKIEWPKGMGKWLREDDKKQLGILKRSD